MSATTVLDDPGGHIAALAQRVVAENAAIGRTLALAESCTGGMVATAVTDVPGSSAVLLASVVSYANEAKTGLLGVGSAIIETFGAVSTACAWAMASGALKATSADVAVAISGVAGPDGGSEAKPVGTVVLARARRGQADEEHYSVTHHCDPTGGRAGIRRQATLLALELLLPSADALSGHA